MRRKRILEEHPDDFITEFNILALALAYQEPGESLLGTVEKMMIRQALERNHGNQKRASKILGISPRVMNYKLRESYPELRHYAKTIDRRPKPDA